MIGRLPSIVRNRSRRYGRAAWDRLYRRRVGDAAFSIVSDDCWGGFLYQRLGRRYDTPFVGLFLTPDDYLTLLERWDELMSGPPEMGETGRDQHGRAYPVGRLGGTVALHFLHAEDPAAAVSDWNRRRARLPADRAKLFLKMADREGATPEHLRRFHDLPFPHKLSISWRRLPGDLPTVTIPGFESAGGLPADAVDLADRHVDTARWLRGEPPAPPTPPVRIAHRLLMRRSSGGRPGGGR